jgi:quercetin dioxygenase-like cupin family protein
LLDQKTIKGGKFMFVGHIDQLEEIPVSSPNAENAFKKLLIGPAEGWDGWVMRLFTLRDKGNTPRHSHEWPHINYVISGRGSLYLEGKDYPLRKGSIAFVPPGAEHQFRTLGNEDLIFICIVPEKGNV